MCLKVMFMLQNVPLGSYSTMRLGGPAAYLVDITERPQIREAIEWARERQLPLIMIGVGSNIVWKDEGFPGLVMVNKIMGFELFEEDADNAYITIGAGENWDSAVERIVGKGYSGVEELSLIPGTAGATPVQNVGAYGREISEVLTTIEAYDAQENKLVTLPASECGFGYRTSRFKTTDRGRYFIISITLHVMKSAPKQPFYETVKSYFDNNGITEFTPQTVRDAVIAIRSSKLPDPAVVANNGSFFQNPVISREQLVQLLADYPGLVHWPRDDGSAKVSAAWLVEQAGFKDYHDIETGMATWANQPLVFVNEHAEKTAQLLLFRQKIIDAVQAKFQIALAQEPELLP
jgi:UDP-N-acetylmuramate dehydrogenase